MKSLTCHRASLSGASKNSICTVLTLHWFGGSLAFPAYIGGLEYNWRKYNGSAGRRPEFEIGGERLRCRKIAVYSDFMVPRLFCLVFTLIGLAVLYKLLERLVVDAQLVLPGCSGVFRRTYWPMPRRSYPTPRPQQLEFVQVLHCGFICAGLQFVLLLLLGCFLELRLQQS